MDAPLWVQAVADAERKRGAELMEENITEKTSIPLKALSFGSLFKIVFLTGFCLWGVISLIVVIIALIAPSAVTINNQTAQSTGQALLAAPMFLIIGTIFSAIGAATGVGALKLVTRFISFGNIS